jgi:hypothetical protein
MADKKERQQQQNQSNPRFSECFWCFPCAFGREQRNGYQFALVLMKSLPMLEMRELNLSLIGR